MAGGFSGVSFTLCGPLQTGRDPVGSQEEVPIVGSGSELWHGSSPHW
jgi:hypothetical protein